MLSSVSNWTNQWHTSHVYEDDYAPLIPKGAVLVLTGYYDNTAKNKGNPDPDQWVGGGSRTSDEMSHAWITVTHLDDEGYKQIVGRAGESRTGEESHREPATAVGSGAESRCQSKEPLEASRGSFAFGESRFDSRRHQVPGRWMVGGLVVHVHQLAAARRAASATAWSACPSRRRVAPFFDGWYANPDGTISLSFGYSNLNKTTVEIPLGPNNLITPKEYDGRQPTSFPSSAAPRRVAAGGGGSNAGGATGGARWSGAVAATITLEREACSPSRSRRRTRAMSSGR